MKYFLLVYDQQVGRVESVEEFPTLSGPAALARRFELEVEYRARPSIEVVLLGAASKDALIRTHGRYFKTARELALPA
jgi:hypothetical protein